MDVYKGIRNRFQKGRGSHFTSFLGFINLYYLIFIHCFNCPGYAYCNIKLFEELTILLITIEALLEKLISSSSDQIFYNLTISCK